VPPAVTVAGGVVGPVIGTARGGSGRDGDIAGGAGIPMVAMTVFPAVAIAIAVAVADGDVDVRKLLVRPAVIATARRLGGVVVATDRLAGPGLRATGGSAAGARRSGGRGTRGSRAARAEMATGVPAIAVRWAATTRGARPATATADGDRRGGKLS
jgi:hypothetical protein